MNKTKLASNIFFLLGIVFLGFLIHKIGFGVIWENIRVTKWWFFAIIGTWGVVYLINTLSFNTIIQDGSDEARSVSFGKVFRLTVSGYAINFLTPAGLLGGEPYRIMQLRPQLGIQKATSSVLLYMMMHIVSHFIFWIVSIPLLFLVVPNIPSGVRTLLIIGGTGSLLLLYWSFTVYSKGFIVKALTILSKIPFVGKRVRKFYLKNEENILQMDHLVADLYNNRKRDFFKSLLAELLSRYVQCIEVIFMLVAIGVPITFTRSVIVESIQSLVGNMFFFIPMQIGAREAGFILVFGILSLTASQGVYVSLYRRIRELIWSAVGILLIKLEGRKKKETDSTIEA